MSYVFGDETNANMLEPRNKLRELLQNLGDALPAHLQHVRREEADAEEQPRPSRRPDASANGDPREESEAGPSHNHEHPSETPASTDFEAEWARLPSAITGLPSFIKIKDLVMRKSTGHSSFQRSLPVLPNGIDYLFMTRPGFRQILNDLDDDAIDMQFEYEPIQHAGLMPSRAGPLSLTEALWESQFGVPRTHAWYSGAAESFIGVDSCVPLQFSPPNPSRLGLSQLAIDAPGNTVHCAVAGTKRDIVMSGPTSGLLYAVVQGSLLIISWPNSEKNFDTWHRFSRAVHNNNQLNLLDDLEGPAINILETGDVVYLPTATTTLFVSLTHVCLTSRTIMNPTSKELDVIVRCCKRMMDTYIQQQRLGYSPYDEMGVETIGAMVESWSSFLERGGTGKGGKKKKAANQLDLLNPQLRKAGFNKFIRGLEEIDGQIQQYRKMVNDSTGAHHQKNCDCHYDRPFETLEDLAELAISNGAAGTPEVAHVTLSIDSLTPHVSSQRRLKGKQRAPN